LAEISSALLSAICTLVPNFLNQKPVMIGTTMDVTMMQIATSAVALGAAGANCGATAAIAIGLAAAAPAVEEAARPAVPLPPPIYLSARMSGIPGLRSERNGSSHSQRTSWCAGMARFSANHLIPAIFTSCRFGSLQEQEK
jgi:hypothetical protein